jgi:hypothetical protein
MGFLATVVIVAVASLFTVCSATGANGTGVFSPAVDQTIDVGYGEFRALEPAEQTLLDIVMPVDAEEPDKPAELGEIALSDGEHILGIKIGEFATENYTVKVYDLNLDGDDNPDTPEAEAPKWPEAGTREAALPVIGEPPRSGIYGVGEPLVAAASAGGGGTLSYRWFSNDEDSNTGGTLVEGANTAFCPQTGLAGSTAYYYVEVTNTVAGGDAKTVTSEAAAVEVKSLGGRIAGASGTTALITLYADESLPAFYSPDNITGADTHISLVGSGDERTVSLNGNGYMFRIAAGASLSLGNNVTLTGHSANGSPVVYVHNANSTLTMEDGSKISGNTHSDGGGGGVVVEGYGILIMNGGAISGNYAGKYGGGVSFGGPSMQGGTFIMKGGTISGNYSDGVGGGVFFGGYPGSSFTMSSGSIFGNNTWGSGGGVSIPAGTPFSKTGGFIAGNPTALSGHAHTDAAGNHTFGDADRDGCNVADGNIGSGGHAAAAAGGYYNTDILEGDNF